MRLIRVRAILGALLFVVVFPFQPANFNAQQNPPVSASPRPGVSESQAVPDALHEYLWLEAENMRGFTTGALGAPLLNPSYLNLLKAKAPGWGMNGPGVSAEWSQGGESEWNSAAASADETRAMIYQDIEIPRTGDYKTWIRYADWASKSENFIVRVTQNGKEVLRREFGAADVVDAHDEVSMYWGWAFTWEGVEAKLEKGPARISIEIEKAAGARRHVDCLLLTNNLLYLPEGRRKPDFAAMRYLRDWSAKRSPIVSLLQPPEADAPVAWPRKKIAGRDFLMPWNINPEFWKLYDQPSAHRPRYPFNAEPVEEFVKKYNGASDVPIFSSKLVVPVIYINNLPELLKADSSFLRYLRETRSPFAISINYGAAQLSEAEWTLLNGELKDQFLGWISGESVGYVWENAPAELKISPTMSRRELLEAHRVFYNNAMARKWSQMFQTPASAMWDKLIPAQSTSSTSFAHALAEWGVGLLGIETAAVQPMFAMRTAFTRGAARQYGGSFLYYHAPNFGDSATTFTRQQNFAGPDNFFHSRYGPTMGPSLSWYRKSYYFYYMSGASAIYLEQGFDQFFKPGPGEHEFQLNPLGRITTEFIGFAEKHPDPGIPYTPIAFLLDPAHGWEMTDYPHWPFEVSQISRSDRALRELFGVAYYPGLVVEGEPATGDRQAFVNGVFGDIFDVLVASNVQGPQSKVQSPVKTGNADLKDAKAQTGKASNAKKPASNKNNQWRYEGDNTTSPLTTPAPATGSSPSGPSQTVTPLTSHAPRAPALSLDAYRAVVVGGHLDWSNFWIDRLSAYVRGGGTVVLNAAQAKGLPEQLIGVRLTGTTAQAHNALCLSPGETKQDLHGQIFRYERIELKGAKPLITTLPGDPLVVVHQLGKGSVVFSALPDLLGEDERMTPFAAHMLAHVFAAATPITVDGDVEYLVNRTATGWVVTVFNNKGVYKPQQGLAQVDRNAFEAVTIGLRNQKIRSASEWLGGKSLEVTDEDRVSITIAPGGIAIVELNPR